MLHLLIMLNSIACNSIVAASTQLTKKGYLQPMADISND